MAARIETIALACGATSAATACELVGLVAQDDDVGALRDLGAGAERLAADLVGQRLRALGHDVGAQHRPTPAEREPSGHAPGADEAELHRVSSG